RVDVHAHIIGVTEMAGVRSRPATHIEHAPHRPQVVVREQRRELLVGEGRLPQAVGQRVLQGGRAELHSRHLTCSQFASSVWGNRPTSASTRSLGGAPENGGRRWNTTTCTSGRSMAASTRAVRPAGSSKESNIVRVGLRLPARKYTSGQSCPAQGYSPWACACTGAAARASSAHGAGAAAHVPGPAGAAGGRTQPRDRPADGRRTRAPRPGQGPARAPPAAATASAHVRRATGGPAARAPRASSTTR